MIAAVLASRGTARAEKLFPLGVYWPHSYANGFASFAGMDEWAYADRILGSLKTNHCNFVWVTSIEDKPAVRLCELAHKHGIRVGLMPEAVMHPMQTRQAATPRAAAVAAAHTVGTFGQVDGIWGYVLDDEPPIAALPYLAAVETELRRLDPDRLVTCVYRRTEAVPGIRHHDFGIVTYNNYPFGHARDPNLPNTPRASRDFFRRVTASLGRQCEIRGITFFAMPGAFQDIWGHWYWSEEMTVVAEKGAYLHWRMPTEGETRWQVWESVAGGAKGVVFFSLWYCENLNRTAPSGKPPPPLSDEAGPRIDKEWDTGQPLSLIHI